IPAVAWLTRTCLTNEPASARAALAAAGGARAAQLSALVVALLGGVIMAVAGLACAVVGSAVGAIGNPPLVRRSGAAALLTVTLVVLALASTASPALAA